MLRDTFLLYCLLTESPATDTLEYRHIQDNQQRVANHGRKPDIILIDQGKERPMQEWANDLLDHCHGVATLLDRASQSKHHRQSVAKARAKVADSTLTPSAKMLTEMSVKQCDFQQYAMQLSQERKAYVKKQPLIKLNEYTVMAQRSIKQQQEMEARNDVSFEQYLQHYYAQYPRTKAAY